MIKITLFECNLTTNRVTMMNRVSAIPIPWILFSPAEEFVSVMARTVKPVTQQRAPGDRAQAQNPQRAVTADGAAEKT